MGPFKRELKPGHEDLKPCPNCEEQEIGRRYKHDSGEAEYYCNNCGYKPAEAEVKMSFRESIKTGWKEGLKEVEEADKSEITDTGLKQQVKDREAEGWKIEEVTDSGDRVVLSGTKGGTVGGHALTGALTGLWTFGLGNVAYGKISKKRNKQRIVLRVDDEADISAEKSEEGSSIELIRELKQLNDEGLITDAEFEEKKQEVLDSV
jgi:predicted RNA-binding Zn-ribbon protein involved in translation (DUF1610 family)